MLLYFFQPFYAIDAVHDDFFLSVRDDLTYLISTYNDYTKENGDFKGVYHDFNKLKVVSQDDNPILIFTRFK